MICPWTRLWWMGATWLYEHKQNHKKSSLKLLVRFWNNLIEIFLEWSCSELFLKFWSVNKHGISEWRLLALYRHKEILVNSSLKATKKKKNWQEQSQKIRWAIQAILALLYFFFSKCFQPLLRQSLSVESDLLCHLQIPLIQTSLIFFFFNFFGKEWRLVYSFLTIDDTRSFCGQSRSRSDCTECAVWSLIYTVHCFILDYN